MFFKINFIIFCPKYTSSNDSSDVVGSTVIHGASVNYLIIVRMLGRDWREGSVVKSFCCLGLSALAENTFSLLQRQFITAHNYSSGVHFWFSWAPGTAVRKPP